MVPQPFELPPPTTPGSALLEQLDEALGETREDQIFEMAQAGNVPMFLRRWLELPVSHGDLEGTVYVLPDFFCLGTDDDYFYTPMGALNAERVGELIGARLPTPRLVQAMYDASRYKQMAQPWGPPYDGSMSRTYRWSTQSAKVRAALRRTKAVPGELVEGHFKNVVVTKKTMDNKGVKLGFWGWFNAHGQPIQGDSQAHGAGYCDYAHGAHYILGQMVAGGDLVDVAEALQQPATHALISDDLFGPYTTYHGVRRANQVTELLY